LTIIVETTKMHSLVLYAFHRSPFEKVSSHAMGNVSSREIVQSLRTYLSQYVLGQILLNQ
jgi:hypothetical protein